jgi:5-methylcytosine-specific restriction endonuclease McrA
VWLLAIDWLGCAVILVIGAVVWYAATAKDREARRRREDEKRAQAEQDRINSAPASASEVEATYQAARQQIIAACEVLRLAAVRKHPLVKFRALEVLTIAGLHSLRAELSQAKRVSLRSTAHGRVMMAVDSFRRELAQDFKRHQCQLVVREIAAGSHGPEDFWENEQRHRASTRGTEATDWTLRRFAVHSRDHGMCLRCGGRVSVEECHVHHTIKSKHRGTNALENLATLCRDCHCLMPAHEHMRAGILYAIYEGLIHKRNCKALPQHSVTVKRSRKSWRTGRWSKRRYSVAVMRANLDGVELRPYSIAAERGHKPCPSCRPEAQFEAALDRWLPTVLRG